MKSLAYPDGDGKVHGKDYHNATNLNFQQYADEQKSILDMILTGILSPATMVSMSLSEKDNADAQREKEKITIMTRNNVIDMEMKIIKDLVSLGLTMKEFMDTGVISIRNYDVSEI